MSGQGCSASTKISCLPIIFSDYPGEKKFNAKIGVNDYGIEVSAGLGLFAGKLWRIGLMGEAAREENAERLVAALTDIVG